VQGEAKDVKKQAKQKDRARKKCRNELLMKEKRRREQRKKKKEQEGALPTITNPTTADTSRTANICVGQMFCETTATVVTMLFGKPIMLLPATNTLRFVRLPNEYEHICVVYFALFGFHFSVFALRSF
jgi:hypothetical protein